MDACMITDDDLLGLLDLFPEEHFGRGEPDYSAVRPQPWVCYLAIPGWRTELVARPLREVLELFMTPAYPAESGPIPPDGLHYRFIGESPADAIGQAEAFLAELRRASSY